MAANDLYKILEIPVSASQEEVKKAYRKLARKYHPDVSGGGKATEHWFRQVHEAYRTLSDPDRRSAYNQQRWYRESIVSNKAEPAQTPAELLQKCRAVETYLRSIDQQRINYEALQQYLFYLLSPENILMMNEWKDAETNSMIMSALISSSAALGYHRFLPVAHRLQQIQGHDPALIDLILRKKKKADYWQNYQFLYMLAAALLLCFLLYVLGK